MRETEDGCRIEELIWVPVSRRLPVLEEGEYVMVTDSLKRVIKDCYLEAGEWMTDESGSTELVENEVLAWSNNPVGWALATEVEAC